MQRPPARPPIGRTRASDAQKLLAPNKKKTVPEEALRRAAASGNAYALGAPLSAQVKTRGSAQLRKNKVGTMRMPPAAVGTGFALLAPLLLLAGVNGFFAAAAAGLLFGGGHLLGQTLQTRRFAVLLATEIDLAAQFDRFVEQSSGKLPDEAMALLQQIKASLSNLLPRLGLIKEEGTFGAEDIFFIEQTVLRYLPDTCAPYFAIPPDRREAVLLNQAQTPKQALLEQFAMLAAKLGRLHDDLVKADAEKLEVHQRFLADKVSR